MSLIDWFAKLFVKEAKHYVFAPVTSDVEKIEFQEGQHYFRLRLAEMFLKDDRKLFRKVVPVVSSVVSLQFGANAAQQLPNVAGPLALNLNESSLGKGVQLNYSLTNLVPYRGGTVSIDAALLAYVSKDYFQSFITLANSVSGLLTSGQLSAALKVVDSAADALQDLLDSGDKDIRLVYHNEYAGTDSLGGVSLTSGYFAVIGADAGTFHAAQLFVKNSQLCCGDDAATAQPLTGYDYMLFSVEAALYRDDFRYFAEYNSLLYTAIEKGMTNKAEGDAVIRAGMLAVFKSDDLTYVDKTRVAVALKQEYEDRLALQGKPTKGATGTKREWLNDRVLAINPEKVWRQIAQLLTAKQQEADLTGRILDLIDQGKIA
ncbi:hypothetical protein [Sporomusa acidovorans]|uniref:Uncharacterized protein n=1 Tax=Sporomusa acidovorans (strain ATCC 49682 / DSM 3132 / Mol) TaxID=1123286 RepID=A0ABZ3J5C2_SPOA4|nr:hypothetical protein [Sporomusa acidovorans]OZC23937.1 hypothetical protein SPACI_03550 [Sporomusa acidovorans DSM 3132]SDF31540.1 hypothetical protein SAMN04488499_104324 [Sporomusa acidovorans]